MRSCLNWLNGKWHIVAYSSQSLSSPERNYSITELETLAVVWNIQHFRAYLYGHEVVVVTDHSAVWVILVTPNPSGKHTQWWLKVFRDVLLRLELFTSLEKRIARWMHGQGIPCLMRQTTAKYPNLTDS